MTILVSKQYLPDDMIRLTIADDMRSVTSFVSSEHLVVGKVLQIQRLYFKKDDDITYQ